MARVKKKLSKAIPDVQIKIPVSVGFQANTLARARDFATKKEMSFSQLCDTALADFIAKTESEKLKTADATLSATEERKNLELLENRLSESLELVAEAKKRVGLRRPTLRQILLVVLLGFVGGLFIADNAVGAWQEMQTLVQTFDVWRWLGATAVVWTTGVGGILYAVVPSLRDKPYTLTVIAIAPLFTILSITFYLPLVRHFLWA
ncbi:MAG: hypothetical protein LBP75_08430 [Planctomycetota bacterium]|jgi:hypothetical protein|nr:hypothetical protein [Planctomycetota bacterium]